MHKIANKDIRLDFLDGLRGWGALSVLLYHTFVQGFPITEKVSVDLYRFFLFNGSLAVWIFFIVSGFSLSIKYLKTGDIASLRRIALGRYIRLMIPILAIGIIVFILFKLSIIPAASERPLAFQAFLTVPPTLHDAFRFGLFDVFFKYDASKSLSPPLWTMAYELCGSAMVIGTLFVAGKSKYRFSLYLAIGVLALFVEVFYINFIIGIVFADIYSAPLKHRYANLWKYLPSAALVAGLIASVFLRRESSAFHFLASAALISFGVIFDKHAARAMSSKLSRFLGRISFPLYLIHSTVFFSYSLWVFGIWGSTAESSFEVKILLNISTVLVSILAAIALTPADTFGVWLSKKFSAVFVRKPSSAQD